MYFVSDEHKAFYDDHTAIRSHGSDYDALIYTLGISDSCRKHLSALYDEKKRLIKPEGLQEGWQTSASVRISRLALHLFTHNVVPDDDPLLYTPKELLSGLDDSHRTGAIYAMMYYA